MFQSSFKVIFKFLSYLIHVLTTPLYSVITYKYWTWRQSAELFRC